MPTLTDAMCKSSKPKDKAYKLFDGGGLHLWISPKGAKVWRIAYRYQGKPKTMSIGDYPLLSLAQARIKLFEIKAVLLAGQNPMQERMQTRTDNKKGILFKESCETYWAGRKDLSEPYVTKSLRGLEMHLYPTLGNKPINSITREDLLSALQVMDAKGLYVYVRKTRMWASQVFDWALENGYTENNPALLINPKKAFSKAAVENFAAVTLTELPDLIKRLKLEGELTSALACKMLALTWVRTKELRLMEWSEIDSDIWRIPEEKMKRRKDHLVPLSSQALSVLEKMKARSQGSRYVFPAEHTLKRPISDSTILMLLYRMGYKGKMTGHGWRSIGSAWANEHGYSPDAIERQLAHSPDDRIRAVYNRAEYLPERRQMLQDWANWLDTLA